jgi:hypothetical protein
LGVALLLAGCATTTLYTGHFQAPNSAGQNREFVLYWNSTASVFSGTKASPVTLLTQCSSRTIQYEERPVADSAPGATQIVFRGEPGFDTAADSTQLPASGVCGRVTSAHRLQDISGPRIEFTVSCKPVSGNPFAIQDNSYLQARDSAYVVEVVSMQTRDLATATPHRPRCPVHN